MKQIYTSFFLWIVALSTLSSAGAQSQTGSTEALRKYDLLFGEWISDGKPEEGSGSFSFAPDLDSRIIMRKNHVSFPATASKAAFTHDDILVIYADQPGKLDRALYIDNEDHVIHYTVTTTEDGKNITFQSVPKTGMPLFRLLYSFSDAQHVEITFQIAQPDSPEAFHTYLAGRAHKRK